MNDTRQALLEKSDQLSRTDDHRGALQILDELLAREPDFYQGWAKRAFVSDAAGDLQTAIEDISRAIAICAIEPAYFDKRGRYLFRTQRYRDAIADFTRVLELCDYHKSDYYRAPAHFARADAHIRLGEYEKAKADLAKIPDDHRAWTDRLKTKQALLVECERHSK